MTTVRYLRVAESELVEAAEFYESQSPGLGRTLVEDIDATITRIVEQPRLGQIVRGEHRQRLLHHFPYKVIYVHQPDEIIITAIAHFKRWPEYWRDRNGR